MGRLRLVFALLAVGLLVPGVLLVRRALDGVAVEQAARHRAVAERVFDEMERTLSAFLQAEEERPVGHYRHTWSPAGGTGGVLLRSPLADPSPEPFVIGHFEVDAEGVVHTPLLPRPGGPAPSPAAEAAAERVLGLARRAWPTAAPTPRTAAKQAPGTTVAVGRDRKLQVELEEDASFDDAYDALQSLNRGAALRQKRTQKVIEVEPASPEMLADARDVPESGAFATGAGSSASAPAPPPSRAREVAPRPSADAPESLEELASAAPAEPAARALRRDEAKAEGRLAARPPVPGGRKNDPAESRAAPDPLVVDPMLGLRLDADHLVLHRTVWRGNRALRQGLILDTQALGRTLLGAALPGLTEVSGRLVEPGREPPAPSGGVFHYRHRFAEPFDALAVDLSLPELAGGSGARSIYGLSLALVLAGSVGLFALYRMVTVVVGFSERRANFVAAVSHELKTPLTAIRMYGEMLRDGMVPSEAKQREYVGTITAESERLSRLIDNVLEFSRLERGSREMSWIVGDLGPVVQEAGDVLAPHAASQGFGLEVDIAPDLPPVRFDRDAVLQVLFNLVDNALKYARDARDKTVRLVLAGEGEQVVMTVRDHGPGVPPASHKRIFEPFHREESELTRRAQGTGIGLSLVQSLAEQMGAALRASNAEDGGFRVALAFPTHQGS